MYGTWVRGFSWDQKFLEQRSFLNVILETIVVPARGVAQYGGLGIRLL